jgi:hypothetical protein
MKVSSMHGWRIGAVCALAPLMFSEPLRAPAVLARGYGEPWRLAQGAWVSSDGKRVAFFTRESSSSEGITRALVVKDVDTDAVLFEKVLFSEEEERQIRGASLERLARARAWEARPYLEQHQWKPLVHHPQPLTGREFSSDACFLEQIRPKRTLSLEGLTISYQEPRLQISRRGKRVLDRRFPSWRVRQEWCERANPSWLSGAFISREQGVVLLELGFCGVDICPEPPAAFHALRLPRDKPRTGGPAPGQAQAPSRAPSVGYELESDVSLSLYATGFPAVSEDGALVAVAEVFADGERKDPNLLITVRRPQTQEVAWRMTVLEAGEMSAVQRSLPLSQVLDRKVLERIRQANEHLGGTRWVPLEEQPLRPMVTESCQQAPAQRLRLPELDMTFSQGHLLLEQGGDSPPIEVVLAPTGAAACQEASRTFIDAAWVEQSRGIVLLRLATCGDETCPEQDRWYHALAPR